MRSAMIRSLDGANPLLNGSCNGLKMKEAREEYAREVDEHRSYAINEAGEVVNARENEADSLEEDKRWRWRLCC